MAEDLNKDQSVADQDLNADVVDQPDLNKDADSVDPQVLADGTSKDKTVPYSELKKATEAKNEATAAQQAAEEKTAYAQRQLELMQQNNTAPKAPVSLEQQALNEIGITADDLYGENIIKYQQKVNQLTQNKNQQSQALFANKQFLMSHPDVTQVVGSVDPIT